MRFSLRLPAVLIAAFVVSVAVQLFASPAMPAVQAEALEAARTPESLQKQVHQWVAELSEQRPFAKWAKATPDIQALGPGTHGWLVVLNVGEHTVGYMVVHAVKDGTYRLGEYGIGPDILFSETTLWHSLKENGLLEKEAGFALPVSVSRHYEHPFAALWEVAVGTETYWLDAKTGELVPLDNERLGDWQKKDPPLPKPVSKAIGAKLVESFDPYERLPWLLGEKPFPVQNATKVQNRIASGLHLRYVTEPFGDAMLYALPVIGYEQWTSGRLDLALDMQGTRFITLDTLSDIGLFYR